MNQAFRCDCPVTSALDILGDKWMLVIIKHMLIEHKQTFKDFTESDEGIATNILSAKLKLLEELALVTKSKLPNNKKTNLYHLTDKGVSLATIVVDLALWSDEYIREMNPVMRQSAQLDFMRQDREGAIALVKKNYVDMRTTVQDGK